MDNSEAIAIIIGAIQPPLIQFAAKNKHGFWKWFTIIMLSLVTGTSLFIGEYGFVGFQSMASTWTVTILKIVAYSLGSWGGFWKKIFKNKRNPLEESSEVQYVDNEEPDSPVYEIKFQTDGVDLVADITADSPYAAGVYFLEENKELLI